ncbi:MAG: L,D-transpeptidase [Acidobacteriota bacterium]|nr:L,D-transpeptidase [Acidobacteriota bacterium]
MNKKSLMTGAALLAVVTAVPVVAQSTRRPPAPPKAAAAQGMPGMTDADRATASQYKESEALGLQIALDKEGFSPGEIDGRLGKNTLRALEAFEGAKGRKATPATNNGLIDYTITAEDAAGPFVKAPADMMAKSKLEKLDYASLLEKLGERFHIAPALLQKINPGKRFASGVAIKVPGIEVIAIPDARPQGQAAGGSFATNVSITVSKSKSALQVLDASGAVVFRAPVTTGSEKDPLPIGVWAVTTVSRNPVFNYNPGLFWDANPAHAKAKIPAGPNNPVGVVWIDLSKEHYGIHGTPEPGKIGYSESHGCIRLTNWDALRVAALVGKGTVVRLVE